MGLQPQCHCHRLRLPSFQSDKDLKNQTSPPNLHIPYLLSGIERLSVVLSILGFPLWLVSFPEMQPPWLLDSACLSPPPSPGPWLQRPTSPALDAAGRCLGTRTQPPSASPRLPDWSLVSKTRTTVPSPPWCPTTSCTSWARSASVPSTSGRYVLASAWPQIFHVGARPSAHPPTPTPRLSLSRQGLTISQHQIAHRSSSINDLSGSIL